MDAHSSPSANDRLKRKASGADLQEGGRKSGTYLHLHCLCCYICCLAVFYIPPFPLLCSSTPLLHCLTTLSFTLYLLFHHPLSTVTFIFESVLTCTYSHSTTSQTQNTNPRTAVPSDRSRRRTRSGCNDERSRTGLRSVRSGRGKRGMFWRLVTFDVLVSFLVFLGLSLVFDLSICDYLCPHAISLSGFSVLYYLHMLMTFSTARRTSRRARSRPGCEGLGEREPPGSPHEAERGEPSVEGRQEQDDWYYFCW
jgi:hypothetical protein